jgi:ATP-dependent DNA helicase RecG
VRELLDQGLIERTIPDKPNSRLQRYRITPAGEEVLAHSER